MVLVRVAAYAVDVQQKLNLQKMLQTRVLRTGFPAISALKRIQVLVNHTSSQRDAGMSQRYVSLCLLAIVAALSPPKASVPPVAPRHASAQRRETGRSDGQTCLTLPRRSAFGLTAACAAFAARPAAAAESLREALAARDANRLTKPFYSVPPGPTVFPEWFEGRWRCSAAFQGYQFPSTISKQRVSAQTDLPGFTKLSIARFGDVGREKTEFEMTFVRRGGSTRCPKSFATNRVDGVEVAAQSTVQRAQAK